MDILGIAIITLAIFYLIIQGIREGDRMGYSKKTLEQVCIGIVSSALYSCVGMEQAVGVE